MRCDDEKVFFLHRVVCVVVGDDSLSDCYKPRGTCYLLPIIQQEQQKNRTKFIRKFSPHVPNSLLIGISSNDRHLFDPIDRYDKSRLCHCRGYRSELIRLSISLMNHKLIWIRFQPLKTISPSNTNSNSQTAKTSSCGLFSTTCLSQPNYARTSWL